MKIPSIFTKPYRFIRNLFPRTPRGWETFFRRLRSFIAWSTIASVAILVVQCTIFVATHDLNTYGIVTLNRDVPDTYGKDDTVYGPVIKVFDEPYSKVVVTKIPIDTKVIIKDDSHKHFIKIETSEWTGWIPRAYLDILPIKE